MQEEISPFAWVKDALAGALLLVAGGGFVLLLGAAGMPTPKPNPAFLSEPPKLTAGGLLLGAAVALLVAELALTWVGSLRFYRAAVNFALGFSGLLTSCFGFFSSSQATRMIEAPLWVNVIQLVLVLVPFLLGGYISWFLLEPERRRRRTNW